MRMSDLSSGLGPLLAVACRYARQVANRQSMTCYSIVDGVTMLEAHASGDYDQATHRSTPEAHASDDSDQATHGSMPGPRASGDSDQATQLLAREAFGTDDEMIVANEEVRRVGENAPRVPCLACSFEHSSGKFNARLLRSTGFGKDVLMEIGSHAFVRCYNEDFLRVTIVATEWNQACGHPWLANETPVLFAGEVEVDADQKVVRWSNLSGTYRFKSSTAGQASLSLQVYSWRRARNNVVYIKTAMD